MTPTKSIPATRPGRRPDRRHAGWESGGSTVRWDDRGSPGGATSRAPSASPTRTRSTRRERRRPPPGDELRSEVDAAPAPLPILVAGRIAALGSAGFARSGRFGCIRRTSARRGRIGLRSGVALAAGFSALSGSTGFFLVGRVTSIRIPVPSCDQPRRPNRTLWPIRLLPAELRARAAALAGLGRASAPKTGRWTKAARAGGLDARDRSFARLLLVTALRRLGQIDAVIDLCLERPLPDKAAPVRDALRLGAAQLLFMDTPAHAAVNSAVALVRAQGWEGLAGLANAVLRRIARDGRGWLDDAGCRAPQHACTGYGNPGTRPMARSGRGRSPPRI